MIYSKNPPFIFVHIPKTAGTSIEEALYHYQDFSVDDNSIHQPMIQYRDYLDREEFDGYFKFCFVRNPFDLMYSTWKYWTHNNGFDMTFEEWILWRHEGRMLDGAKYLNDSRFGNIDTKMGFLTVSWYMNRVPQTYWFVDEKGNFLADFIGSFEYLQQDFNTIVKHLDLTDTFLPHANKGRHENDRDYRIYYTDRAREIIEREYALDLQLFGYDFDTLIPSHDRFGFVTPERNSISKLGEDVPKSMYINHTTLPYGFSQNLKRHSPGDDFEEQIRNFETEKLRKRSNSLKNNLYKISDNIRNLEDELFDMEETNDYYEKQQLILKERELELLFKLKLKKIEKELQSR